MNKTTTENSPAETDDARSTDTPEANKNRDALAKKAEEGLNKAVQDMADKPDGKA